MFISGGHMPGEKWKALLPPKKKEKKRKEGRQLVVYPGSSPSPDPHLMTQWASEAQRGKGPGTMEPTINRAGTKTHPPVLVQALASSTWWHQ